MGENSISFEDFSLVQNQVIELKTENYNLVETVKRYEREWKKLKEDDQRLNKELEKSNRIVSTSKKHQEVAGEIAIFWFPNGKFPHTRCALYARYK